MHAFAELNYCALGGHLKCFVQTLHISITIEIDDYFLEEDAFLVLITRVLLPRALLVVVTAVVLRLICLSLNSRIIISLLTLDL